MMKKYEIRKDLSQISLSVGSTLYRIQALRNFGDVKKGDFGGFIENEKNLSHKGDCWIYDNAYVYDKASVSDSARVYEYASIWGNTCISEYAKISGNVRISGNTKIYGHANICGSVLVYGNVRVFGEARVYENAALSGNVWVLGNAVIHGVGRLCGNACVYGYAKINLKDKSVWLSDEWFYGPNLNKDFFMRPLSN